MAIGGPHRIEPCFDRDKPLHLRIWGRLEMLQIIGWLGCFYLIVKCLEIAGNGNSYRPSVADPEKMEMRAPAYLAIVLAVGGAIGFAWWLGAQGGMFDDSGYRSLSDIESNTEKLEKQNACAAAASGPDAIMACFSD